MQSRILTIPKNPDCPVCSKTKDNVVLSYSSPVCGYVPELTPVQACEKTHKKTHEENGACLIDVREDAEWNQGHIDGARHWPLSRMMAGDFPEISQGVDIILHCQKGGRSLQAAQILLKQGYFDVYSLAGGYDAWLKCFKDE